MAVRKPVLKDQSESGKAGDVVEQKMVELAEQVGWFLGTVQAKAEGWLDRDVILKEVGRIRDGAADLLAHVNRASASARKAGAKAAPSTVRDRWMRGKRHGNAAAKRERSRGVAVREGELEFSQ